MSDFVFGSSFLSVGALMILGGVFAKIFAFILFVATIILIVELEEGGLKIGVMEDFVARQF
jgi:hypothetical protein